MSSLHRPNPESRRFSGARRSTAGWFRTNLCALLCVLTALPVRAADKRNFADLSIEELMNESVMSVSRRETRLEQSPAAITVVSSRDIRRLGATTIAEALRYVPGLNVARLNASQWAISARGFNSLYANKLLVLMDGRTLYTPMSGGVFWDTADTAMADIDQIEIIRGPGATLWGANAVNGVINIITKNAQRTQGTLVSTSTGTEERISTTVRHGGKMGDESFYRVYAKHYDRKSQVDSAGRDAGDDWEGFQSGFRLDWKPATANSLTLQGDYHVGRTRQNLREVVLTAPFSRHELIINRNHGANVLGRWTRAFSASAQLSVQAYVDHSVHSEGKTNPTFDTADLDMQHRFSLGRRHDITWGLGYRHNRDEIRSSPIVIWTHERRTTRLASAFIQDQIALGVDRLSLVAGSKFERYDSGGVKAQPGIRLLWTPTSGHAVWAASSRAFKIPTRFQEDARLNRSAFQPDPSAPVMELALIGNPNLDMEEVRAHELGYRFTPGRNWSIDLAAFYNDYRRLIAYEPGEPRFEASPAPAHLVLPLTTGNTLAGHTYGAEASFTWRPVERWRLEAGYSWLEARLHPDRSAEGDSPRHQVHVISRFDLSSTLELNSAASYVGALKNSFTSQFIAAYTRLDLGLLWRPKRSFEAGIWGQNLLEPHHAEFSGPNASMVTEIRRGVSARVTWRY